MSTAPSSGDSTVPHAPARTCEHVAMSTPDAETSPAPDAASTAPLSSFLGGWAREIGRAHV